MTKPRFKPDLPRMDDDTKAWIFAAVAAGATPMQCAVFVHRKVDTVYTLLRGDKPVRHRKQVAEDAEANWATLDAYVPDVTLSAQRIRCEDCGGIRSDQACHVCRPGDFVAGPNFNWRRAA